MNVFGLRLLLFCCFYCVSSVLVLEIAARGSWSPRRSLFLIALKIVEKTLIHVKIVETNSYSRKVSGGPPPIGFTIEL